MDELEEVPFFFQSADRSLFAVLHRPSAPSAGRPAFVFCHPLAEEKLWSHRVFVSYARRLAAMGYPVLRFDFSANGDSDGTFSDIAVSTFCDDLRRAISEVRHLTGASRVSLLGLRLGANVAMMVADETPEVQHLILWSPISDGSRYLQDLLRINLMTQMAIYKEIRRERPALVSQLEGGGTVNVDGYDMGWPLYASISMVTPGTPHLFQGPCLIVQIDKQPRPSPDLLQIASSYSTSQVTYAQEEPFWKEIATFYQEAPTLFRITTDWLAATEGDHGVDVQ